MPGVTTVPATTSGTTNRLAFQAALDRGDFLVNEPGAYYRLDATPLVKPTTTGLLDWDLRQSVLRYDGAIALHCPADLAHMQRRLNIRNGTFQGPGTGSWTTCLRLDNHGFCDFSRLRFEDSLAGINFNNVEAPAGSSDGYSEMNKSSLCAASDVGFPLLFTRNGGKRSFARHSHSDWDLYRVQIGVWGATDTNTYEHRYTNFRHVIGGLDNATTFRFDSKVRGLRISASAENVNGSGLNPTGVLFSAVAEEAQTADIDFAFTHRGWGATDAENTRGYDAFIINDSPSEDPRWRVTSLHVAADPFKLAFVRTNYAEYASRTAP